LIATGIVLVELVITTAFTFPAEITMSYKTVTYKTSFLASTLFTPQIIFSQATPQTQMVITASILTPQTPTLSQATPQAQIIMASSFTPQTPTPS